MEVIGDDTDQEKWLKSNKKSEKTCLEISQKKSVPESQEESDILLNSNTIEKMQDCKINDSSYLIYHPPKYTLPPYHDPKVAALNLRDQVKVICSYHALISRSIANQAKIQINSCSYPEPIDPISNKTDSPLRKDVMSIEESKGSISCDNYEEYVSRAGRITKRKFYLEAEVDHNKVLTREILESSLLEGSPGSKGDCEDKIPTRKKAALTSPRTRNLRQKQFKLDTSEEEMEIKKKNSITTPTANTIIRQQKRGADGFVKPATPTPNKKAIKKTIQIQCPICCLDFPEKQVEQHASSCGEIPVEEVGHMNASGMATGFRCHSCKEILTTMEAYENHRTICNGGPSYL